MKFDILNKFSGTVQFSVEIECAADALPSIKLGLAVRAAIKHSANLRGAYLRGAYLRGADLSGADLSDADLSDAYLNGADLSDADLSGADLSGAYLSGADLSDAKGAELAIAVSRILPDGQLIGWKKLGNGTLAKLSIPADARRSHAFGRKCRAEFVDVLEGKGVSAHDGVTRYAPGLRVVCHEWETDWTQECAGGIHFFITREEAEDYAG